MVQEGIEFTLSANTRPAENSFQRLSRKLDQATQKVTRFSKLMSSVGRITFYRGIRAAIRSVTESFSEGLKNAYAFSNTLGNTIDRRIATALDSMTSSANRMKNQLGAAFGSLLTALQPVISSLISLVTAAANAITQLFAAFTGGTYLRARDVSAKFADNMKKGAGAAKEWKNQLMGFDVINRLSEPSSGGGGSGVDASDLYEVVEVESRFAKIAQQFKDLVASIKLNFNDVFFNWSDLNPENIAKKLIVGLSGLFGGITGFMLGGVPGAIVGTILGVTLGLTIDSVFFDGDGQLSKTEIGSLLKTALVTLLGGVIGFYVGGPGGALLGATFTLGVVGTISALRFTLADSADRSKYRDSATWFLCGVLGLPTDQQIIQWGKNAVKWIGDGFKDFGTELYHVFVEPFKGMWAGLKKWWSSLSLGTFHIPRPRFEWTYEAAQGILADALKFVGLPALIPHLNIAWYAKGGIVNGATLIGAGEAGKEAIIPLDRNKEWIRNVASELYMYKPSQGSNDVDNGEIVSAIFAAAGQIVSAISENSRSGEIDWPTIARTVTKYQNRAKRANGY